MIRANIPVPLEPPWIQISSLVQDGGYVLEVMAAACFDGIGVIAVWSRHPDGWGCRTVDTEQAEELFETEGEPVPAEPPIASCA